MDAQMFGDVTAWLGVSSLKAGWRCNTTFVVFFPAVHYF